MASLAGCGNGDSGADAAPATPIEVEVGTGTTSFVAITDDQDLELVAGPQGGHHFIVHCRGQLLAPGDPQLPGSPDNPATSFAVFTEDEVQVDQMFPPYRIGFESEGGGWHVMPSGRILQVQESAVDTLYGSRVRIEVHVEDAAGGVGTDEVWVNVIAAEQTAL